MEYKKYKRFLPGLGRLCAVILILLTVFSWPCCPIGWTRSHPLVASGHPEYPPFVWNENGQIIGVGPEIFRMVFEKIGVEVEIPYLGNWAEILEMTRQGEIDGITGIYYTTERETDLVFSIPFAHDPVVIFVLSGKEFPLVNWDSLVGKIGVSTLGISLGESFDIFAEEHLDIIRAADVQDCFRKLIRQEADFLVYGLHSGLSEAARLKLGDSVTYLQPFITVNEWYFAFSKRSPFAALVPEINPLIEQLITDRTVESLIIRYIDLYKVSGDSS